MYLTVMGSQAYGCHSGSSDMDIYGVAIPRKDEIFPHLRGEIQDFGTHKKRFSVWIQHHVFDDDSLGGKGREYDFNLMSITKYFDLCLGCNPNCIDSLFTPENCVLHQTSAAVLMRENRKLFLSKSCFPKFKGYAASQLSKIKTKSHKGLDELREFEEKYNISNKTSFDEVEKEIKRRLNPDEELIENSQLYALLDDQLEEYYKLYKEMKDNSTRAEKVKSATFDLKFAMHLVRLLDECEQILMYGDLDIQRNREQLKAIRRGEMSERDIENWAIEKNLQLEKLFVESKIPEKPREEEVKELLLRCLEHHYGSLDKVITLPNKHENLLREIQQLIENAGI